MRSIVRMSFWFLWIGTTHCFSQNTVPVVKEFIVYFESASSVISKAEMQKIEESVLSLTDVHQYSIELSAHTDSDGNANYNTNLSAQRALAVTDFLVNKGFFSRKVSFVAKGESQPIAANESDSGKAQNRRVTVKIQKKLDDKLSVGGFTIAEKIVTFSASEPQKLYYPSGTVIEVPENAFVDKNGNRVVGDVQLSYIEYRDPVDFILGNIPMDHEENGKKYHFNSAGMFKVLAYKNNEEVYLKKDKKIDLDFQLTANLPNLNFYEFKQNENKWQEINKLSENEVGGESIWIDLGYYTELEDEDFISGTTTRTVITNAYDNDCQKAYRNLNIGLSFSKSTNTIYDPILFVSNDSLRDINNKRGINDIRIDKGKTKQSLFNNYQKRLNVFCVLESDPQALENKFTINVTNIPGLKSLKKIVWEGNYGVLKGKTDTIILSKIEKVNENVYQLHFNDSVQEYVLNDIKIELSKMSQREKEAILKYSTTVLASYENKGDRFQKVIDKQNNQLVSLQSENEILNKYKSVKIIKKNLNEFWVFSTIYMDEEERNLGFREWLRYFDQHKGKMLERYTAIKENDKFKECFILAEERNKRIQKTKEATILADNVTQKLSISSLGIYNCDQIQRLQEPLIVEAEYENEQGEKVVPLFIYVVDKSINGILRYDGYNEYGPNKFAYSSKSESTLLAFDGEGNAYVYSSHKMKNILTSQKQKVKKLVITKIETITNKEQLTALLN